MKKQTTATAKTFVRTRRLSDAEIVARVAADPESDLPAAAGPYRRPSLARRVRHKLGLSQPEFAKRFGIPLGTLRDWEQHRCEPDQATRSYLAVIAANPNAVREALEPA